MEVPVTTITIEEAKEQFVDLMQRAAAGEEFIIIQQDNPQVEIVMARRKQTPKFGSARDLIIYISDDFDEPLEDFAEYM
jgi:antitoxin (DNA-binding transcriptional repressor) of toxin-antitoxin stability system